jgi:hypothetical protein
MNFHRFIRCLVAGFILPACLAGCVNASSLASQTSIPSQSGLPPARTTTRQTATAFNPTPTLTSTADISQSPEPATTSLPTLAGLLSAGAMRPLLLAHYMPWYQSAPFSGAWGWHWTMNHFNPDRIDANGRPEIASYFTPLTGPYDSSDPALLEYQVLLMKLSGIDGVIVDWYGNDDVFDYGVLNHSTQKLIEVIRKAGLKFVICYEDQTILHMVENKYIPAEDALSQAQKVMRFLDQGWFKDPAYLKYGDRPVLLNFGLAYFKNETDWEAMFRGLHPQPLLVTEDNPLGVIAPSSYPWPPMSSVRGSELTQADLQSYLDVFYLKSSGQPYRVAGAFPGFRDIYKEAGVSPGYAVLDAREGETFRLTLQTALAQHPDVIQLVTWNDYGEGTNIEPTREYGYRYLEMLQDIRRAYIDPGFRFTTADLELPLKLYQAHKAHSREGLADAELDRVFLAILTGDLQTAKEILANYP